MERNAEAESESNDNKETGRQNKAEENEQNQTPTEKARTREAEAINSLCGCSKEQRHVCCVCLCVWVTPSLSQESGHTRTFNEVWAAYYGASLSQTFKERDVIAVHPFTYTAAHAADSLPKLPAAANFNRFLKERQLCKSVKQHEGRTCVPEEEHRRNLTAFPLMKTVKPTEGFSAGTSSESLCSF